MSRSTTTTNSSTPDSSENEVVVGFMEGMAGGLDSVLHEPVRRNNSMLQGRDWVGELIASESDSRFYDAVRMTRSAFFALREKLRPLLPDNQQARVPIDEAIVLFMRTIGMHHRHRDSEERFQHSLETISRQFHRVLDAVVQLYPAYVTPRNVHDVHPKILNNSRFYPYFKDAIGAIDGTLIHASIPASRHNAWRSRRGDVSQNVLAICDFDLMFTYVYAGWEGSATDAHVLQHALINDDSFPRPPEGKYYLVDAGYANYTGFLAPYRSTRYHLQEYHAARLQPRTPSELFNYRHSQLRNHIERCFGLLKSRFAILRYGMPRYSVTTQVKIVQACCIIHNFIRSLNIPDSLFDGTTAEYEEDEDLLSHRQTPTATSVQEQSGFRDALATMMWEYRNLQN